MRPLGWFGMLLLAGVILLGYMFLEARRMPVMRTATIGLHEYPPGKRPLRVALLADSHLSGPDNSPKRMERVIAEVNAARPDLVILAGDYVGDRKPFGQVYSRVQAIAPFARLRAPLGVVAVLGNHDHWDNAAAIAALLSRIGATVLANQAVRRGPIVIGGIDDGFTDHANVPATLAAARRWPGARLFVSHSPDVFPDLPPGSFLLAGHTHCGQIVLPLIGAISVPSRYGDRYLCGRYDGDGKTMIVAGGLGTSVLPLRLGAPPDYWLITIEHK